MRGIEESEKSSIWGAGNDFEIFMKTNIEENRHNILGVIDSDIKKQGKKVWV